MSTVEKIILYLKTVACAISGLVSTLFGPLDGFFYGLLVCVVADYITGICAAIYNKSLDSRTGFTGILKKLVILVIVALSHTVGQLVEISAIRDMVIGFYIANEGLSVLENAAKMNIRCTKKLKSFLAQIGEKE